MLAIHPRPVAFELFVKCAAGCAAGGGPVTYAPVNRRFELSINVPIQAVSAGLPATGCLGIDLRSTPVHFVAIDAGSVGAAGAGCSAKSDNGRRGRAAREPNCVRATRKGTGTTRGSPTNSDMNASAL